MRLKKGNQGFLLLFLMGICMLTGCNFGSSVDEKADNEVQIDAVCEEKTESSTEEQMKEAEYFAAPEDMFDACLLGDEVNSSQVSSNEVAEINESASVSDSNFTITLGMLFKDFHYDEEEIPSDVVVNNHGGTEFVDGSVQMDFYIKEEQVRKITLHY